MGYQANGSGNVTIKSGKSEEIKNIIEKIKDTDFEFDVFDECIDIRECDSHWHEDDTMDVLNALVPYITEGEMDYIGDDDCMWRYRFDGNEWVEEGGTVYYSNEDMIAHLRENGYEMMEAGTTNSEDEGLKNIRTAYETGNREISADYLAGLLMDPEWSSYKMFEDLAQDYINASPETRKGIDIGVMALTGWKLSSIAAELIRRNKEE